MARRRSSCGWYVGVTHNGRVQVRKTCEPGRHPWKHAVGPLERKPDVTRRPSPFAGARGRRRRRR